MPLKNPLRIVITIGSPGGDGEQILTVIEDEDMPQNWQLRTADYTAQNRDRIIADTSAAGFELKLPPGARYGDEVEVLIDGTNALTINPNGAKVNGAEASLPITSDRAKLAIVYKDSDRGWLVGTGSTSSTGGGEPTPSPTPTPSYIAEAQAVISAIEATGTTLSNAQKTACNNRITALKADVIWNKLIAYYGFLGGTAASHAINWKSPGTYDMVWDGEVLHTAQGVQGDGLSGRGGTGFNPSVAASLNTKTHLAFYCRSSNQGDIADAGVAPSYQGSNHWLMHLSLGGSLYYDSPFPEGRISVANSSPLGFTVGIANDAARFVSKNGATIANSSVPSSSIGTINRELTFMAYRYDNGVVQFSNRQYSSFSFGLALSQSEAIAYYTSEQAYQQALGRQV